jgi:hypothetical protein
VNNLVQRALLSAHLRVHMASDIDFSKAENDPVSFVQVEILEFGKVHRVAPYTMHGHRSYVNVVELDSWYADAVKRVARVAVSDCYDLRQIVEVY